MTKQQQKLLQFLHDYTVSKKGISPSFAEMMEYMDIKSSSDIHRIAMALKDAGFITQKAYKARAIYVTDAGRKVLGQ